MNIIEHPQASQTKQQNLDLKFIKKIKRKRASRQEEKEK